MATRTGSAISGGRCARTVRVTTWTDPPDDRPEPYDVVCITCLNRPPKAGSIYCGWLCRVFDSLRKAVAS